jgi:hypothetical protein
MGLGRIGKGKEESLTMNGERGTMNGERLTLNVES